MLKPREEFDPELFEDLNEADKELEDKRLNIKYYKFSENLKRDFQLELSEHILLYQEDKRDDLGELFVALDTCEYATQTDVAYADHAVQTPRKITIRRSMFHKEGGFSRLVNVEDQEKREHFKNLFEKEKFIERVPIGVKFMETFIYTTYFANMYEKGIDSYKKQEYYGTPFFNVFAPIDDPWKFPRPIADLAWHTELEEIIAAAYVDHRAVPWEQYEDRFSYVWNTRNRVRPVYILDGPAPLTVLEFNNMEPNEIAACTITGQLGLWDMREDFKPFWLTDRGTFHDTPTSLQWTSPTTGYELTAAALDGQILWYDMRNRKEPFDKVILDMSDENPPKWERALGITSYHFDPAIPTKFLAGTTAGSVIIGNKKGKTNSEKIGKSIFQCHDGPIMSVARNVKFPKYFVTVGDWLVKIWSEEHSIEPISWTDYGSAFLTTAAWSKVKNSILLVGRDDGQIDLWDFLECGVGPRFSIKVSDAPIRKVIINDFGQFSAAAGDDGTISVMRWSRHFGVFTNEDINRMSSWFERELRREKMLEIKLREARIRKKKTTLAPEVEDISAAEEKYMQKVNDHFKNMIAKVIQKRGEKLGLWEKVDDEKEDQ